MKNNTFDVYKSLHAVLYIAERLRRSDFHKIFKILYFSDREHLMEYGRLITIINSDVLTEKERELYFNI